MKEVTYYECEVCGRRYSDRGSAEFCEGRVADPYPERLRIGKCYDILEDGETFTATLINIRQEGHTWICEFDDGSHADWTDIFKNEREDYS